MKSTVWTMMVCATCFLTAGCETPALDKPDLGPLFCDIEQPRRFDAHVLDWRLANDRDNLALDAKTNAALEACPE